MKIALLHYSFSPVVGGVETIVRAHAEGLASRGMEVKVICGHGNLPVAADYELHEIPELRAETNALNPASLKQQLLDALGGCQVVVCHNMLTMPFHNTAANVLIDLASGELRKARFIHWTHDIASLNSDYCNDPRVHSPGSVIARCHAHFEYVCISEERLNQLATLPGYEPESAFVIPNGIDLWGIWGIPPHLKAILVKRGVPGKEVVLFHPARLLPRKRVERSIEIAAALRDRGISVLLIVSGAPDPHKSGGEEYAWMLQALVTSYGLENEVLFAGVETVLDDSEIAACYRMCDAVIFPSAHEGFGLPVIEAAAHGKLLVASDIATTRSHLCGETVWMGESTPAEQVATAILASLQNSTAWKSKRAIAGRFSWEEIFAAHLLPLLQKETQKPEITPASTSASSPYSSPANARQTS